MRSARVRVSVLLLILVAGGVAGLAQRAAAAKASDAWVKLPAAGETAAMAFAAIENPGMYAIYLVSAASDAADRVEFKRGAEPQAIEEVPVEAYETLYLSATGTHLVLSGLKRPLTEGDTVAITLTTELGLKVALEAVVKKE